MLVAEDAYETDGVDGIGGVSQSTPVVSRDNMDDVSPCLLYVLDDIRTILVARGTMFQVTTIVHVDDIIIPDVSVPLSTYEIFTSLGQEKIRLSEDDPLGALQQLCDIIANEPLKIEYDANVFGRDSEVPLYLHSQHVRELASRREKYMFGVSNNLGYNDVYGFIDPQIIHEGNNFYDITTYLTSLPLNWINVVRLAHTWHADGSVLNDVAKGFVSKVLGFIIRSLMVKEEVDARGRSLLAVGFNDGAGSRRWQRCWRWTLAAMLPLSTVVLPSRVEKS
ncbi:hypothetical protein V8G54_008362 [Vigna mungo]|uniref:Uncharacterized protein n=1 Tax=Vigna mungo TaxID=3915 RepID=A0AAQ3P511_VIGMU